MSELKEIPGLWLAMDTSTEVLSVALLRDGQVIGEKLIHSERNHSIYLLPAVQELLSSGGLTSRDLNGIAVGHGPGSYTGIRIGVTVAKTFAWSLKLPLIGISSLEALAYGAGMRCTTNPLLIVPFMDARRGKVYTGLYGWDGQEWSCLEPDGIRMMDHWLEAIQEKASQHSIRESGSESRSENGVRVILAGHGEGFAEVIERFRSNVSVDVIVDGEPLAASSVGALAERYGLQRAVADVHAFEPNYTQLSEPEKMLVKKR